MRNAIPTREFEVTELVGSRSDTDDTQRLQTEHKLHVSVLQNEHEKSVRDQKAMMTADFEKRLVCAIYLHSQLSKT